jgi:hypothetical protein
MQSIALQIQFAICNDHSAMCNQRLGDGSDYKLQIVIDAIRARHLATVK